MSKIFISGLGLIGSSLARLLKKEDNFIIGFDKNLNNERFMIKHHFIDEVMDFKLAALRSDVIFLAGPVDVIINQIKILGELQFKRNVIVSDVGSTKHSIISEVNKINNEKIHFIGGHPISGSQLTGSGNGKANLFQDTTYFLIPNDTSYELIQKLQELLSPGGMNFKLVSEDKHDKIVANISHLPHAIAFSMVNNFMKEIGDDIDDIKLGGGFLSTTRTAAADPVMWNDIFMNNSTNLLEQINSFENSLNYLKELIKRHDQDKIRKFIEKSQKIRNELER